MTSIFDENGKNIPCTVMKLVLVLLQVRTKGVDGYEALQLGFDKTRNIQAALGHFKKAGTVAKKKVVEFKFCNRTKIRRSYRCLCLLKENL
jgi:large subunit ribosomal protein L3